MPFEFYIKVPVEKYIGTISKDIREFQTENNEVLPLRGTIYDLGPTLTYKKIIIKQFLRNAPDS
jgi:uncharacterized protein DUF1670